jgi:hypothetical protein
VYVDISVELQARVQQLASNRPTGAQKFGTPASFGFHEKESCHGISSSEYVDKKQFP